MIKSKEIYLPSRKAIDIFPMKVSSRNFYMINFSKFFVGKNALPTNNIVNKKGQYIVDAGNLEIIIIFFLFK